MTKRFFISYSLITLFLLDSVVLFAQCENAFAQQLIRHQFRFFRK